MFMMQQIFLKRWSREQTTPAFLSLWELSTHGKRRDLSYVAKNSLKKVKSERWRVNHCHKIEWSSQKIGVTSSQLRYKRPFRRQNRSRRSREGEKTGGRHSIQYSYSFLVWIYRFDEYPQLKEKRKLNLRFTFILYSSGKKQKNPLK